MRTIRGVRISSTSELGSGMHLHGRLVLAVAVLAGLASADNGGPTGWQQVLSSVNLTGDSRIHIAGANDAATPDWPARIEKGAVLILEGESRLASSLGFRPTKRMVTVTGMRDVHQPKI